MVRSVVKITQGMIESLRQRLMRVSNVQSLSPANPYEAFRVRVDGDFIVAYTSGKIVVNGSYAVNLLAALVGELEIEAADYDIMVGSDEAGKGEWLGPLTVAAVALSPKEAAALRVQGIMDSKELRLEKIADLTSHIYRKAVAYHVLTISPRRFNELWKQVKEEGGSLNSLLAWAHSKAILQTYSELRRRKKITDNTRVQVVIDEFDRLKTEKQLARVLDTSRIKLIQKPRAEEYIAVAAASILARQAREDWIDKESRRMGLELRRLNAKDVLSLRKLHYIAKVDYLTRTAN